jgi:NADPH-dependent F420 reductase
LAAAGTAVTVGSRDAARARELAAQLVEAWPDRPLTIDGAANAEVAGCDVVVAATPWQALVETMSPLADGLAGKVVICVANALVKEGREMHALIPPRGSVAAELQAALPESLVAAAAHHLPAAALAKLDKPLEADVLVCSDSAEAKRVTIELVAGVDGLRPLDAGSMASASAVEAFTAVLVTLNMRYRSHSTLRLAGLTHTDAR